MTPIILTIIYSDSTFEIVESVIESARPDVRLLRFLNADDALELLQHANEDGLDLKDQPVSFILIDYDSPGMSGLDVLLRLKEDERTRMVPVIVMNSTQDTVEIKRAYWAGAAGFIEKSPDEEELFRDAITAILHYWLSVVRLPSNGNRSTETPSEGP